MKCYICEKRIAVKKHKCLRCYERIYRKRWRKLYPNYMKDYMRQWRANRAKRIEEELFNG